MPEFLEELYLKRFGRERPERVVTIEERAAEIEREKQEKRERKQLRREAEQASAAKEPPVPF